MTNPLCEVLNLKYPIIQAPMAGVSTPELAAAVSNSGALGSISVGAATAPQAREMIYQTQALTTAPFNVNVFCHPPATRNPAKEQAWIKQFSDMFHSFGSAAPTALDEIYATFCHNSAMLQVLLDTRPAVVSFHFGLPEPEAIQALKTAGCLTLASATSPDEARLIAAAGVDFIIAQGFEAGGHRGAFLATEADARLSTSELLLLLQEATPLPVICAGGIMNGTDIARVMQQGAAGVQMGTAFILCPESAANTAYRGALSLAKPGETCMTSAISGRPARSLNNAFCKATRIILPENIPDYPVAYSLGKALAAAAQSAGEAGFGAQWAGTGAHRARKESAARLVEILAQEWQHSSATIETHH
ncbi:NAD(P)H-dependent flavin oxidoreductase [Mangrovibacter plantisponsor]|nr:nitronate monooxygenase [Mangrovibacter plantisponsor]